MTTKSDLDSLGGGDKNTATAPPSKTRSPLPAAIGTGSPTAASGGSEGLKSPIVEQSRTSTDITFFDASGLIAFTFAVATEIVAKDANGAFETRNYSAS